MKRTLQILFYLASVAAVALWWWSALVNIPSPTWAGLAPKGDFMSALNHAAHLNGLAAFTTGVSVFLSALRERFQK